MPVYSSLIANIEPTVAYLGPAGSYSHAGARELFGLGARYAEAATIDGVFDAVRGAHATFGAESNE